MVRAESLGFALPLAEIPSPLTGERARVRGNQRRNFREMLRSITSRSPSASQYFALGPSSPVEGEGEGQAAPPLFALGLIPQ
jgi:hypothetical protein